MKTRILILVSILLLLVVPLILAEDQEKEIPVEDAMNVLCGTWIMDKACYGVEKQIWNHNETYQWYYKETSTQPDYTGTFKIEKAWRDRDGNIWFINWRSFRGNSWTLSKISNAGTVLEFMRCFSADRIPTKIDPDDARYDYFKLYRK